GPCPVVAAGTCSIRCVCTGADRKAAEPDEDLQNQAAVTAKAKAPTTDTTRKLLRPGLWGGTAGSSFSDAEAESVDWKPTGATGCGAVAARAETGCSTRWREEVPEAPSAERPLRDSTTSRMLWKRSLGLFAVALCKRSSKPRGSSGRDCRASGKG